MLVIVGCAILLAAEFGFAQSEIADPAAVTPLGLKVMNEKVPSGGMLQLKLSVTEPKPILKGNPGRGDPTVEVELTIRPLP
jgi:hypothetical protein